MEISKFLQAGVDNRETEKNHNDESHTFDEEREDQEIRENMKIMSISSRPLLSSKFSYAYLSSYVSFFSPCLIQETADFLLSF